MRQWRGDRASGGWETQYCHMRRRSVRVKPGDALEADAKLGEVGASGEASFPHVHLTVRRNGQAVDQFDGGPATGAACGIGGAGLWSKDLSQVLACDGNGDLIDAGFHSGKVDMADLEAGRVKAGNPAKDWAALVAYMWAINLSEGDKITVTVKGPDRIDVKTLSRSTATRRNICCSPAKSARRAAGPPEPTSAASR